MVYSTPFTDEDVTPLASGKRSWLIAVGLGVACVLGVIAAAMAAAGIAIAVTVFTSHGFGTGPLLVFVGYLLVAVVMPFLLAARLTSGGSLDRASAPAWAAGVSIALQLLMFLAALLILVL